MFCCTLVFQPEQPTLLKSVPPNATRELAETADQQVLQLSARIHEGGMELKRLTWMVEAAHVTIASTARLRLGQPLVTPKTTCKVYMQNQSILCGEGTLGARRPRPRMRQKLQETRDTITYAMVGQVLRSCEDRVAIGTFVIEFEPEQGLQAGVGSGRLPDVLRRSGLDPVHDECTKKNEDRAVEQAEREKMCQYMHATSKGHSHIVPVGYQRLSCSNGTSMCTWAAMQVMR